jgi:hypothetical protein
MHFGLNTYSLVALMDRVRSARGTSLAKRRRAKRIATIENRKRRGNDSNEKAQRNPSISDDDELCRTHCTPVANDDIGHVFSRRISETPSVSTLLRPWHVGARRNVKRLCKRD